MLGLDIMRSEDYFQNVFALYATLAEGREQMRVKRAELNMNNEVAAQPIDFMCDVEVKTKRNLTPRQYALFKTAALSGEYRVLPLDVQMTLGRVWALNKLGTEGAYASLYFRVKNAQAREMLRMRSQDEAEPNQFD